MVELLRTKYKDRVIRVLTPQGEQFGARPGEPGTVSAGTPDPKIVDIAASALAAPPPDLTDLEKGVSEPFYQRWWFWTLVGVAAVGAGGVTLYFMRTDTRSGRGLDTGPIAPLTRP